jgi:cysteine sulfinate desulfinase/cysteine desulfurase-like protein
MGLPREDALASVRLSLGFASTDADVTRALEVLPDAVARLRDAARAASPAGAR